MKGLLVHDVVNVLEQFAPLQLAMPGDPVGLQIGRLDKPVERVRLALDASPQVIANACRDSVDLLITHHALIYRPLSKVDTATARGQALAQAFANELVVYTAHTNLDIAEGGVNDVLASLLGVANLQVLDRMQVERLRKLVVFVPDAHHQKVFEAICAAGGGHIGAYSHCTFNTPGEGTFLPLEGTHPFIGRQGIVEHVQEVRLETIVREGQIESVVQAMLKAHPYEEVAYDIYPLEIMGKSFGLGRIGELPCPQRLEDFAEHCRRVLGLAHIRFSGDPGLQLERIAILGGSGGKWVSKAIAKGAQVMLTSDCDHHLVAEAWQDGLAIVDATHAALERPVLARLQSHLQEAFGDKIQIDVVSDSEDPFRWI